MIRESAQDRRERLRRQKTYAQVKAEKPPEPIKISLILRILSMIIFANIFNGKKKK